MLTQLNLSNILHCQREFFQTGKTKNIAFRIAQLKTLKQAIIDYKSAIVEALKADLGKPEFETFITEISVTKEIDYAIKRIKSWVKPQTVAVPIAQFPATAQIYPEPLGVVAIFGAWNYPVQLIISPLVGAIAAGNCVVVKPSEIASHTSQVLVELLQQHFDPAYIAVVAGGIETSQQLLAQKFDHIFFTGGTTIGKIVMEAAAKQLTPVTLELGGKSPCIVDSDINITHTARRITWGKFINAGQTCIAPDYLLVNKAVKPELIASIQQCIQEFYGDNPAASPDYGRIVNHKQFSRLVGLLPDNKIVIGGESNAAELYLAPTVLDQVSLTAPVMQAEIFGPILPIIEYSDIAEAIAIINHRPKPLALYLFSQNKNLQRQVIQSTSSGNVCINDTVMQVGISSLPFGGVGDSGIGNYHGLASFDTFSHYKSVLQRGLWFDLKLRYAPYTQSKLQLIKRFFGISD